MAHPCYRCGSECYCSGDIDDVIVSRTPARCESCGCEEDDDFDNWPNDGERDEWPDGDDPLRNPDCGQCAGPANAAGFCPQCQA